MTSAIPSWEAFPDAPVFGATRFAGRTGLAHNLLSRCLRRQSILLYGGPKLGKTSLLLHLQWLVDQDREASSAPVAVYLDLSQEDARNQLLSGRWANPARIVLLDHCEHVATERCAGTLRELMKGDARGHAIVWAGARSWHDFVVEQIGPGDLRRAPLAVLLEGEARALLEPYLASGHLTAAFAAGGTHPYVLKMIARELLSLPGDPGRAVSTAAERLVPFFHVCRQALRGAAEEALLQYLVQEGRPINPRDAAKVVGVPTIKAAADALCCIGLISRWNLNEGAMLHANCRLFNDWYLSIMREPTIGSRESLPDSAS